MAKIRLTDSEISQILGLLEAWEGPLTWDLLMTQIQKLLRRPFTRQGLAKQEKIQIAFKQTKDRLRSSPPKKASPQEIEILERTIGRLKERVKVLEAVQDKYDAKFATWLYNARSRGMSEAEMNRPLPPVDRGRSTDN